MPKHVEYWLCEFCETEHDTLKAAEECEKKAVVLPKFINGEVVELSNGKLGVISWPFATSWVHKPSMHYDVEVRKFFWNKIVRITEDQLKKTICHGTRCPLCKSVNLEKKGGLSAGPFAGYRGNMFVLYDGKSPLNQVVLLKCVRCETRFHSQEQIEEIRKHIEPIRISLLKVSAQTP